MLLAWEASASCLGCGPFALGRGRYPVVALPALDASVFVANSGSKYSLAKYGGNQGEELQPCLYIAMDVRTLLGILPEDIAYFTP